MANFIPINTGQRLGAQLRSAVDQLNNATGQLARLKATMDTMTDGKDFATLESQVGLQSGDGEAVYNLVAGVVADLTGVKTSAPQLVSRCG